MTDKNLKVLVENLKVSQVPGKTLDGAKVRVKYKAFNPADAGGVAAAKTAVEMGMDKDTYTGILDKRWVSVAGDLIITVLALERIDPVTGKYAFRSFNLNKGKVLDVQVLS